MLPESPPRWRSSPWRAAPAGRPHPLTGAGVGPGRPGRPNPVPAGRGHVPPPGAARAVQRCVRGPCERTTRPAAGPAVLLVLRGRKRRRGSGDASSAELGSAPPPSLRRFYAARRQSEGGRRTAAAALAAAACRRRVRALTLIWSTAGRPAARVLDGRQADRRRGRRRPSRQVVDTPSAVVTLGAWAGALPGCERVGFVRHHSRLVLASRSPAAVLGLTVVLAPGAAAARGTHQVTAPARLDDLPDTSRWSATGGTARRLQRWRPALRCVSLAERLGNAACRVGKDRIARPHRPDGPSTWPVRRAPAPSGGVRARRRDASGEWYIKD